MIGFMVLGVIGAPVRAQSAPLGLPADVDRSSGVSPAGTSRLLVTPAPDFAGRFSFQVTSNAIPEEQTPPGTPEPTGSTEEGNLPSTTTLLLLCLCLFSLVVLVVLAPLIGARLARRLDRKRP